MSAATPSVRQLYKQLLFMGREYPLGYDYFRKRAKAAFLKNKDTTSQDEVIKLVDRGVYVMKELETLYMLRKYRALKSRYYPEDTREMQLLRLQKMEAEI